MQHGGLRSLLRVITEIRVMYAPYSAGADMQASRSQQLTGHPLILLHVAFFHGPRVFTLQLPHHSPASSVPIPVGAPCRPPLSPLESLRD